MLATHSRYASTIAATLVGHLCAGSTYVGTQMSCKVSVHHKFTDPMPLKPRQDFARSAQLKQPDHATVLYTTRMLPTGSLAGRLTLVTQRKAKRLVKRSKQHSSTRAPVVFAERQGCQKWSYHIHLSERILG